MAYAKQKKKGRNDSQSVYNLRQGPTAACRCRRPWGKRKIGRWKKHKAKLALMIGILRSRPLQVLRYKVPRGGALPPDTLQRHERGAKSQINIPKPRLGALLVDLVAPALLCTRESLGTGVSGCCMMYKEMAQTDWGCSAGALILLRLHCHEGTTATARCLHGQDQDSLNCSEDKTLSATLPSSWPSRPRWRRCASPRKGPDRWQAN